MPAKSATRKTRIRKRKPIDDAIDDFPKLSSRRRRASPSNRTKRKAAKRAEEAAPPSGPGSAKEELKADTFLVNHRIAFAKPAAKLHDLVEAGPVHLLRGQKGQGLLIHHLTGADSVSLQSLTTGMGFSLDRDSARLLAEHLAKWAGPAPSASVSEWTTEGECYWKLAE